MLSISTIGIFEGILINYVNGLNINQFKSYCLKFANSMKQNNKICKPNFKAERKYYLAIQRDEVLIYAMMQMNL